MSSGDAVVVPVRHQAVAEVHGAAIRSKRAVSRPGGGGIHPACTMHVTVAVDGSDPLDADELDLTQARVGEREPQQ